MTSNPPADPAAKGDSYPDEPIAAFAWPLLVRAGGLAEITGGKLLLTAKGRAALGKPAAGVVQVLWRSWLTKGLIDEFSRVENIKCQRAANVLTTPKARRQKVSEALAAQPAGEWEATWRDGRDAEPPSAGHSSRPLLKDQPYWVYEHRPAWPVQRRGHKALCGTGTA